MSLLSSTLVFLPNNYNWSHITVAIEGISIDFSDTDQIGEFHGFRSARAPQLPMHVSDEAGKSDVPRYLQPFEGRGALCLVLTRERRGVFVRQRC